MSFDDARPRPVTTARAVRALLLALAIETAIVIAHFAHSARLYDDPYRLHVIHPAIGAFVLAAALSALVAWRPNRATLVALAAAVTVPFIAMFGVYHGVCSHLLKDAFFLAGASAETLERNFMNPDYAYPDSVVFETGGLLTIAAAGVVAARLVRLWRVVWAGSASRRTRAAEERA